MSKPEIAVIGSRPYDEVRELCHKVKDGDPEAVRLAARMLYDALPEKTNLICTPSHDGRPTYIEALAESIIAISRVKGDKTVFICTSLRCYPHRSLCEAKHEGEDVSSIDIRCFWNTNAGKELALSYLRKEFCPVLLDNVIDSGKTARACLDVLWPGTMVAVIGDTGNWKKKEQ